MSDSASNDKKWVHVWDDKKDHNLIEAWIMMKDPLTAEYDGIGLVKVIIEDETIIGPGPTSSRIAVVDYDSTCEKIFKATEPKMAKGNRGDAKKLSFKTKFAIKVPTKEEHRAAKAEARKKGDDLALKKIKKRTPDFSTDLTAAEIKEIEADLHFHQVNVWATVHTTMDLLEESRILGRRIPWAFKGGRIKILPHAFYDENAHYDVECGAICFGYFHSKDKQGKEKLAFTCLSHDIVTHELGHAILDGLKPYYSKLTSDQCGAFAEYFGDLTALTSMFIQKELIVEVAGRRGTVTNEKGNLFSKIGKELGGASAEEGTDASTFCVRNAQNKLTVGEAIKKKMNLEEHDYSKVLSGAYFDFLELVYEHELRKMVKHKQNERDENGKRKYPRFAQKDLNHGANVAALYDAAAVTRRMMLRALDYCPPVDLSFFDYAQGVYLADKDNFPHDSSHREMWQKVCIARGICSKREGLALKNSISNDSLRHLDIEKIASSKTEAYNFVDANREVLNVPKDADFEVINLYRTNKTSERDYRVQEIIIEFVWAKGVLYEKRFGELNGTLAEFWCGGTLVFSPEGNLLHYALKKQDDPKRLAAFMKYSKFLYDEGWIAVEGTEKGMGASMQKKINASIVDGRVTFSKNAAMRCKSVHKQNGVDK